MKTTKTDRFQLGLMLEQIRLGLQGYTPPGYAGMYLRGEMLPCLAGAINTIKGARWRAASSSSGEEHPLEGVMQTWVPMLERAREHVAADITRRPLVAGEKAEVSGKSLDLVAAEGLVNRVRESIKRVQRMC